VANFSWREQNWSGLLADTVDSCTVAVVTHQCLELRGVTWESICQNSKTLAATYRNQCTVLETAVIVNEEAGVPKGLTLNNKRWKIHCLQQGAVFDLGDSGRLKYLDHFYHCRGALVKWDKESVLKGATQIFREKYLKMQRSPCHWEQVLCLEWPTESIPVHVTSSRL
jgi:hypothetical protein